MIYSLFQQSTPIQTHTHSILCQNSRLYKENLIQKKKKKKSLDSEYIENGVSLFIRIFVDLFWLFTDAAPEGVSTEW